MSLNHFRRPFDVVKHPTLEPEVKRAILASWTWDKAAVPNPPDLRRPAGLTQPIHVRDVLAALTSLDRQEGARS